MAHRPVNVAGKGLPCNDGVGSAAQSRLHIPRRLNFQSGPCDVGSYRRYGSGPHHGGFARRDFL